MDLARLHASLAAATSSPIPPVEWVDEIDSTSSALLRRAAELPDRVVLLADRQTAGRGRRGRPWVTPPGGNLALSIFARLTRAPSELGGLSLALGVACAETLQVLGAGAVRLKWPNDLLVGDRKLGGLLVELARASSQHAEAVVGLGLNLRLPAASDPAWIGLHELGVDADRVQFAAGLIGALLLALDEFERAGFAAFAERWERLDGLRGKQVRVIAADVQHHGTALGVRADGALLVGCGGVERAFASADVSVRAP